VGGDSSRVGQAVALLIRSEKVKDADDAVRLANAASRLLASLRKGKRRTAPTSLSDILKADHDG
jgi:hypothetical protein